MPNLTKYEFKLLGDIFATEISGNLPHQSRSKKYPELEKRGLVMRCEIHSPGYPPE